MTKDKPENKTPKDNIEKIKKIGETGLYIVEKDLGNKKGYYNEETGEIAIHKDQTEEQKFEILIHEMIHACETACINQGILKKRVNHLWVESISANLALLLKDGGIYTPKDQVQAECESAYYRGYEDGRKEEHTSAMEYIDELRDELKEQRHE